MKRLYYILILPLLFITLSLGSCSFETDTVDGDGKIEGMWHLESIEYLGQSNNSKDSVQDLSNKRLFWSFQHKLLKLNDADGYVNQLLCRFTVGNGKLNLTEFYIQYRDRDSLINDVSQYVPYGIYSANPSFDYNISGGRLTLRTDSTVLRLRKF